MAQAKRGVLCSLDPFVVPGFFWLVAPPAFYLYSDQSMACSVGLPVISDRGSAGVIPDCSGFPPVVLVAQRCH